DAGGIPGVAPGRGSEGRPDTTVRPRLGREPGTGRGGRCPPSALRTAPGLGAGTAVGQCMPESEGLQTAAQRPDSVGGCATCVTEEKEAARRLYVSTDWVYRRTVRLPSTVRMGRALRCSAEGIDRYISQRQGW